MGWPPLTEAERGITEWHRSAPVGPFSYNINLWGEPHRNLFDVCVYINPGSSTSRFFTDQWGFMHWHKTFERLFGMEPMDWSVFNPWAWQETQGFRRCLEAEKRSNKQR